MPVLGSIASAASKFFSFPGVVSLIKDAYYSLTIFFLKFNIGLPNDTIATTYPPFTLDSSPNNFPIIVYGGAKSTRYSPYLGSYYSTQFNGSTGYLTVPTPTTLALGASNWTVECWIQTGTITSAQNIIADWRTSDGTGGYPVLYMINAALYWRVNAAALVTGGTVPFGIWSHVAVVKNGSTTTIYLNGVSVGSASDSITYGVQQFQIGKAWDANYFNGNISGLRVVVGTAVYTSNFNASLPTAPLTSIANTKLLTCQNNNFIDASGTFASITPSGGVSIGQSIPYTQLKQYATYGSGLFNGTTDYVSTPNFAQQALGAGDFTVECWIYTNTVSSAQNIIVDWRNGDPQTNPVLYMINAQLNWRFNNVNSLVGGTVPLTAWAHVAVARVNGVSNMYLNGVSVASVADTNNYGCVQFQIGKAWDSNYFNGYISNFRIVTGTSLYTNNFAVPTLQLSPSDVNTSTQMLTLQYSGNSNNLVVNDSSSSSLSFTNNSSLVSMSSMTPFSNRRSVYLTGTTSMITIPANAAYNMNQSNYFTVEAWLFPTLRAAVMGWFTSHQTGGMLTFYITATGTLSSGVNPTNGVSSIYSTLISTTVIPLNAWTHVAIVRDGNTMYHYINGVRDPVTLDLTGITIGSYGGNKAFYIGGGADGTLLYTGYISNLRYVLGQAVYTGNFSPSVDPVYISQPARTNVAALDGSTTLMCMFNNSAFLDQSKIGAVPTYPATIPIMTTFGPTSNSVVTHNPGYYSVLFNGTTDFLTLTVPQIFTTNAFSIECWVNIASFAAAAPILGTSNNGALAVRITNNTTVSIDALAGASVTFTVPTLSVNTWYHIAVVRDSLSNATVFVNGVRSSTGTQTISTNFSTGTNQIGLHSAAYISGYITNLRIYNGATPYDPTQATITLPTSPLTNAVVGSTTPIFCLFDTYIYDKSNITLLTSTGTAVQRVIGVNPFGGNAITYTPVSNTSPMQLGGSIALTGVSPGYLISPSYVGHQFGANDFTVECWIYVRSSVVVTAPYICVWNTGVTASCVWFLGNGATAGTLRWAMGNGSTIATSDTVATTTVSVNRWINVAVTRQGSNVRIYANGVVVGTAAFSQSYVLASTPLTVGATSNGASIWTGNVTGVKITNGVSKYNTYQYVPSLSPPTYENRNTTFLLDGSSTSGMYDSSSGNHGAVSGNMYLTPQFYKSGTSSLVCSRTSGVVNTLAFPHRPEYDLITGDFTIEFWIYPLNFTVDTGWILNKDGTTGLKPQYAVAMNTSGNILFTIGASNANTVSQVITSLRAMNLNQWNHIACTRTGTTLMIWMNGVPAVSGTTQTITMIANSGTLYVNNYGSGVASNGFDGYLDEIRISRVARYTIPFTPPTASSENG